MVVSGQSRSVATGFLQPCFQRTYPLRQRLKECTMFLSAITYRIYVVDKQNFIASQQGEPGIQQIANRHLHLLGLIGGWPGAWIGQRVAQFKTRKARFIAMRIVSFLVHLLVLFALGFGDHGAPMRF